MAFSGATVLTLGLLAGAAAAAPEVAIREEHYVVSGSSPSEIRKELNRLRPKGRDGYTSWHVAWRFHYMAQTGTCRMTSVVTSVTVTRTLPRWDEPAGASAATRAAWARYRQALSLHEDGHRDIGVSAANEIDTALRGMTAASCAQLAQRANETGYRMLDEARAREREYDRSTNYGATQGAKFP